ncbi:neutral zinc metallopeptidase [Geodermatophilus sp. SYSU D00698]
MDLRTRSRGALAVVVALGVLLTSGCSYVVIGQARSQGAPSQSVGDDALRVVGATDGPIDTLARNALADLQTFWSDTFPAVFGQQFQPLTGGYFSVDPDDVDPAAYPEGIGCGADPRELENNAFYCSSQGVPNSDSISYDRAFLGELAAQYGEVLPQLVMAHEYGHAVQARVGDPQQLSIAIETQADCLAGAWTAWVADGNAEFSSVDTDDLDQLLRGYFLLRDPVGRGTGAQQAHGSYFDRVSAFQEGFDDGAEACRDNYGPGRVFTQGEFTSDEDFASGGNADPATTQQIIEDSLPEFWTRAFSEVLDAEFTPPQLETTASPPDCAPADVALVYCPDGGSTGLVAYDGDFAEQAYELGDFALVTGVAIPYALSARDQLDLSTDDTDALRSAVCLTGWYSAQVYNNQLRSVRISPGDIDESVQFLLEYGNDPDVLADVELTGFQLVDVFRAGFLQGAGPCDVGV